MNQNNLEFKGLMLSFAFHTLLILSLFFGLFSHQNHRTSTLSFAVTFDEISSSLSSDVSNKANSANAIDKKEVRQKPVPNQLQQDLEGEKIDKQTKIETSKKTFESGKEKTNSIAQEASFSKDSKASYDAAYLNNPSPEYPPLSRSLAEEGVVSLKVLVSIDGSAKTIELQKTSGYRRLDNAAIDSVKKWKFVPAIVGGNKVESWIIVPVKFLLDKAN